MTPDHRPLARTRPASAPPPPRARWHRQWPRQHKADLAENMIPLYLLQTRKAFQGYNQWAGQRRIVSRVPNRKKHQSVKKIKSEVTTLWGTIPGFTSPQHVMIRIIVIIVTIVIAGISIVTISQGIQLFSKGPLWSLIWTNNTAAFLLFQDLVQNNTVSKSVFFRIKSTQILNWLAIITLIITMVRIIRIIQ